MPKSKNEIFFWGESCIFKEAVKFFPFSENQRTFGREVAAIIFFILDSF